MYYCALMQDLTYVEHEFVCVPEALLMGHKVSKKVAQNTLKGNIFELGLNRMAYNLTV